MSSDPVEAVKVGWLFSSIKHVKALGPPALIQRHFIRLSNFASALEVRKPFIPTDAGQPENRAVKQFSV
jgi:hypothetical protein